MSEHAVAKPVGVKMFSRGTWVLVALMVLGGIFAARRFLFGIGSISNLDNQYPWGIWIGFDVATGVALAAGGFTSAALAHVFHQDKFHAIVRPALLTAMLGYTFVVLGLLVDLGRFYNVWHPILPMMWSGHSVLFEVGICVMFYLTVLYIEFMPIVVERFMGRVNMRGVLRFFNRPSELFLRIFDRTLGRVMGLFILAGVVLSCLHQSSLGALMALAPTKMHPLWWSPILPLMFLLSAFAVGFPMVIFESLLAAKAFRREPEMDVLAPLARYIPTLLGLYLAFRIGDLALRDQLAALTDGSVEGLVWLGEVGIGFALPMVLLWSDRIRRSPNGLLAAAALVVLGVAWNRIDVFLVAYRPLYADGPYIPAFGEIAVTVGLISTLIFVYRFLAIHLPIIAAPAEVSGPPKAAPRQSGRTAVVVGGIMLLLLTAGLAAGSEQQASADCTTCHVCPQPTTADPCLKIERCARHAMADNLSPDMGPDIVIMDQLEHLYVPVRFLHRAHAEMVGMSGGCTTCHHYSPPHAEHPSCRECHPSDIQHEDLSQPGLKGVYHRQCLGCHADWDNTMNCEVCHEKKESGPLQGMTDEVCEHSNYEPIEMKELILFSTDYEDGDIVPFHHANHSTRYELNCSLCHREQSCVRCHVHRDQSHPMGELQDVDMHDTCYQCHGEQDCSECHGRDPEDLFNHRATGWPLAIYHANVHCRACHGDRGKYELPDNDCRGCHSAGFGEEFRHRITGVILDDIHGDLECSDCHVEGFAQPPACGGCHDDGRRYERSVGFGN